jgi:hypothetical protein
MFIHFVRFKTQLPKEEVRTIMEERAPRFRSEVAGLVQKYYGCDPQSGPSAAATSSTQKIPAKHSVRAS